MYRCVLGRCERVGLLAAIGWLMLLRGGPAAVAAEVVRVGAGSYWQGLPDGAKGPEAPPRRGDGLRGPVPTNDWWSSVVFSDQSFAQFPHPLAVRVEPGGLRIALPRVRGMPRDILGIVPGGSEDLVIRHSAAERFPAPVVDGYSDWFVSLLFAAGPARLRVTYGHGSPFVFATYAGGSPRLQFAARPELWSGGGDTVVLGLSFAGQHYGVFAPRGATWRGLDTATWDCITDRPYFAVAVLPDRDPQTLAWFARHAYAHVVETQVTWAYDQAPAAVTTRFDFTTKVWEGTEPGTIFALYPHQWRHATAPLTDKTYASVRGKMKVGAGQSFATRMTFPGVLPALPGVGGVPAEKLAELLAGDTAKDFGPVRDTYWEGKELGRIATLAATAEAYGLHDETERLQARLTRRLESWFWVQAADGTAKRQGCFAYEPAWGTLIGYPASYGSEDQLNDHHFHYGYFVKAAAEVARRDPAWAADSQWGGMVRRLIRDIASPDRQDAAFPFLRCFDPYAGHSWASGHARFGDGNNNESSSEAMNAWAGLVLWGEATGDRPLRDLGVWLYTTELHAIEENWFNVHGDNFPPEYTCSLVAMVWGGKSVHATWFSGNPEMIHGINWLPLTGASLYLGRWPEYVERNYRDLAAENLAEERDKAAKAGRAAPAGDGTEWDAWQDIVWMVRALTDPDDAIAQYETAARRGPVPLEAGNSHTHLVHWLYSLRKLGRVDRTVTADTPCYAVFRHGPQRTYTAYNHGRQPLTVKFSDDATLDVPPAGFAVTSRNR